MKPTLRLGLIGFFLLGLLLLVSPSIARADSVITDCRNDSQLTTALAAGGNLSFNCGTAIITFNGQKIIGADTTIEGGGKITFNGANATRFFYINPGISLTLNNLVLTNGYSGWDYAGAVYVVGGTLVLNHTTIQDSKTENSAGGAILAFDGSVTLNESIIQRNASQYGAVNTTGTLTINRSVLQDNAASDGGGTISAGGTITIDASILRNNRATRAGASGGAILMLTGQLNLTNSTLTGNSAGNYGGGIYSEDTAYITNVTFSGNSAPRGGGMANLFGAAQLKNVTFSGNSASNYGGAIVSDRGFAIMTNGTLSGNTAPFTGGLYNNPPGQFYLTNTAIARGANGANCSLITGGSFSLSDDNSCLFGAGDNIPDLMLGPLSYNGSSIQTHLPLPGSPVIDGGTSSGAPTSDARGYSRGQGFAYDVGAVEVCTVKPNKPNLTSPLNNAKYKGTLVALNWDDTYCADKYKVTIKDAVTGAKVQGGSSASSDFKTKALVKGKSYKWFVQACNTIGCTKSDLWKFTIK